LTLAVLGAGRLLGFDVQGMGTDALTGAIIAKTKYFDCIIFSIFIVPTEKRPIFVLGIIRKFIPIGSL